jgi:hypothetical protein
VRKLNKKGSKCFFKINGLLGAIRYRKSKRKEKANNNRQFARSFSMRNSRTIRRTIDNDHPTDELLKKDLFKCVPSKIIPTDVFLEI